MNPIAFIGPFCSGKSTLAQFLVHEFGYTRIAFADAIKRELAADLGITVDELNQNKGVYRPMLQNRGSEARANDPEHWVKVAYQIARESSGPVVVDDMRFLNEAVAWRILLGAEIVGVYTPESVRKDRYFAAYGRFPTEQELNHESEQDMYRIRPDFVISGSYDLQSHRAYLKAIAEGRADEYRFNTFYTPWYVRGLQAREIYRATAAERRAIAARLAKGV